MATIQGQLNTPRDTTIQATNTALGLLGKDASLQDIKAALLQIVAALDPTADDYDQLSNKPQVNGVTLSGNKTSKQLGIRQTIPLTSAQYAQLTSAEKMDVDKDYIITDANVTAAPIDDDSVSRNKVWSSYKVDEELDTLNSAIAAKPDIQIQSVTFTAVGYNQYAMNVEIPTGKNYAIISADPAYVLLGSQGYVRIMKADGSLFTDQTISFSVIVLIF